MLIVCTVCVCVCVCVWQVTECEIFLSLLVKFLDGEKPQWLRAVAVESVHRLCVQPHLLR